MMLSDAELSVINRREAAAEAALKEWRKMPKGGGRRQALEALVAAHPGLIEVEWLPDNKVRAWVPKTIG